MEKSLFVGSTLLSLMGIAGYIMMAGGYVLVLSDFISGSAI